MCPCSRSRQPDAARLVISDHSDVPHHSFPVRNSFDGFSRIPIELFAPRNLNPSHEESRPRFAKGRNSSIMPLALLTNFDHFASPAFTKQAGETIYIVAANDPTNSALIHVALRLHFTLRTRRVTVVVSGCQRTLLISRLSKSVKLSRQPLGLSQTFRFGGRV